MFKRKKIFICLTLFMVICASVFVFSCKEAPIPEKLGEIEDITKFYFENQPNGIKFSMNDYLRTNGAELTYETTSSNSEIASKPKVEGGYFSVSLEGGDGSSDIQIKVKNGSETLMEYKFKINSIKFDKVACVGDSLTYGHAWHDEAYPVYLQQFLGKAVKVENFGVNGASVTGFNPPLNKKYALEQAYKDSIDFDADVVVLMLGTNDSKGWNDAEKLFTAEYEKFIAAYKEKNPDVKIIMVGAAPTMDGNKFNIPCDVIRDKVVPKQKEIAENNDLPYIDFMNIINESADGIGYFIRGEAASDGVHLTVDGAKELARLIEEELKKY